MILISNKQLEMSKTSKAECSNSDSGSNYDVLCGKNSYGNPGNEYFRKLIQIHREAYRSTTVRDEKRQIIDRVIREVHSRGGRFLKTHGGDEISYTHQYEKVSHALRSARGSIAGSTMVQTKAELAGNVNSLLETQRRLYQQYCRDAGLEPIPAGASSKKQGDGEASAPSAPATVSTQNREESSEESFDEDVFLL